MSKRAKRSKDADVTSTNTSHSGLLSLPAVLLRCIFVFLEPDENIKSRRTSRAFNTNLRSSCPDSLHGYHSAARQLRFVMAGMTSFKKADVHDRSILLACRATLQDVAMECSLWEDAVGACATLLTACQRLRQLQVLYIETVYYLRAVLLHYPGVHSLHTLDISITIECTPELHNLPSSLTVLDILVSGEDPAAAYAMTFPSHLPTMEKLVLKFINDTPDFPDSFITAQRLPRLLHLAIEGIQFEPSACYVDDTLNKQLQVANFSRSYNKFPESPGMLTRLGMPSGSTSLIELHCDIRIFERIDFKKHFPALKDLLIDKAPARSHLDLVDASTWIELPAKPPKGWRLCDCLNECGRKQSWWEPCAVHFVCVSKKSE